RAACSHVTRARRTIASSRASMSPPQAKQLQYHILEPARVVSNLCAELFERTEPYDPPAVQHEDAGGDLLRCGYRGDGGGERGARCSTRTTHGEAIEPLRGVEGRGGLADRDHGSGGEEGREERHPAVLASRQPPRVLARQSSPPEPLYQVM